MSAPLGAVGGPRALAGSTGLRWGVWGPAVHVPLRGVWAVGLPGGRWTEGARGAACPPAHLFRLRALVPSVSDQRIASIAVNGSGDWIAFGCSGLDCLPWPPSPPAAGLR